MGYSDGRCDNCNRFSVALTTHVVDGATVRDCPDCIKYPGGQTAQMAVDRETQKVWEVKAETTYQPAMYCVVCHRQAPYKLVERLHPGNLLGLDPQFFPDLTGWAIMFYPFKDPYHYQGPEGSYANNQLREADKLCPTCIPQVKGTINHMKDGYHED